MRLHPNPNQNPNIISHNQQQFDSGNYSPE
jgi:hypothetical protein